MENKTCEWASHPSNRQQPVCEEPATKCVWFSGAGNKLGEQAFYICEKHYNKGIRKGRLTENKTCEWAASKFNGQNLVCEEPATKCIWFRPRQFLRALDEPHPFYMCEKHYKEFWEGPIVRVTGEILDERQC